jgi:peptide/nickel transport system permease protein
MQAVPVVIGIVVLNFLLLQLAPGDVVDVLAGESGYATPEYMATLRAKFGLDTPWYVQLVFYLKNILTFDLGYSFRHGMPVAELILARLAPTALLMGTAFVLAVVVGTTLGVMASRFPNTWRDSAITGFALLCYAAPLFWVGLMFIIVFSLKLDLLPISGMETIAAFHTGFDLVIDVAHHLILPAVTLSLFYLAVYTRMARASMLEVARLDYVTMARAKGLKERQVVYKHMLKNALLPVLTMAGVQMAGMLGGSVIVESLYGWPGLGLLAFNAFFARDLNLLLGIFFLSSILVLVVNLMVDMIYSLLDPRIDAR